MRRHPGFIADAFFDPLTGESRLWAAHWKYENQILYAVHSPVFEPIPNGKAARDFPPLAIHTKIDAEDGVQSFMQAVVDAAWEIGIKPRRLLESRPGELGAVRQHLEDMRALIFKEDIIPRGDKRG